MAQLAVHGNWRSIMALALFLASVGLIVYAVAESESLGVWPYLVSIAAIFFGFYSKEDHLAVLSITSLSALMILDILLRIGVLAFNECHDTFGALHGC